MSEERNILRSLVLKCASVLAIALVATARPTLAQTPVGTAFTYQGDLQQGGTPVDEPVDGCDFEFSLWSDPASVDPLDQIGSTLMQTELVNGGRFTATLDFGADTFTGSARWLEIAVCCAAPCGDFATLSPRQELTPAPNALRALGGVGPPGAIEVDEGTGKVGMGGPPNPAIGSILQVTGGVRSTTNVFSPEYNSVAGGPLVFKTNPTDFMTLDNAGGNLTTTGTITSGDTITVGGTAGVNGLMFPDGTLQTSAAEADGDTLAELVCASGEVAKWDGAAWVCDVDIDTDTTYDGSDFTLSNQSCSPGDVVVGVNATGAVICAPDLDTDTDTTYDGTDFALSNQSCNPGDAVVGIDAAGAVSCAPDIDTDTDTLAGLVCAADEVARWDGVAWVCDVGGDGHSLDAADGDPIDALFVDNDGAVGIGTAAPAEQLEVVGNIKASGTLQSGNSIFIDGVADTISSNGDLELHVNDGRALRVETNATSSNIIGGFAGNNVTAGVVGATVGGGGFTANTNRATDNYGTIGGGALNRAGNDSGALDDTHYATVGGGYGNTAGGSHAAVGGGFGNTANGNYATVAGGLTNTASANLATVGGGNGNVASHFYATVSGGANNAASGQESTVAGGNANNATADWATISGGQQNSANADHGTVPGGRGNLAAGSYSFAAGRRAKANHAGAFVWADSNAADCLSTADNEFRICADGGVNVAGDITASGTLQSGNSIVIDGVADTITASSGTISFGDEILVTTGKVGFGAPPDLGATAILQVAGGARASDFLQIGGAISSGDTITVGGTAGIDGVMFPDGTLQTTAAAGGGTLDDAYDSGGAGAGRTITADTGAVTIAGPDGLDVSGPIKSGNSITIDGTAGSEKIVSTDAMELHTSDGRGWRLEPATSGNFITSNITGGSDLNSVGAGVIGATIAGGGQDDTTDALDLPNSVTADFGTVGGGRSNTASGISSTVGGGGFNTASGTRSTVCGGSGGTADGLNATVAGGKGNSASGIESTVSGGLNNWAIGDDSTVGGGEGNRASGDNSTVGGGGGFGLGNSAFGDWSTIPGGYDNDADGAYSFAAGRRAKAIHAGAFVWADSADADCTSTAVDEFRICAAGGVDVEGNLHASGTLTSGNSIIIDGMTNTINSTGALGLQTVSGNVGIGTTAPGHKLEITHATTGESAIFAEHTTDVSNTPAIHGKHVDSANGYGVGVRGEGGSSGVEGTVVRSGSTPGIGINGWAGGTSVASSIGVQGFASGGGTNFGVHGSASGGTTNWAGYFAGNGHFSGNVGIGATAPVSKLQIKGGDLTFEDTTTVARAIRNSYDLVFEKDIDNNNAAWFRWFDDANSFEQMRIFSGDEASISGDGTFNSNGLDYAEAFKILEQESDLEAGEVVSLALGRWEYAQRTAQSYDPHIIGVVSTQPSFLAGMSFDAEEAADPAIAQLRDEALARGDAEEARALTGQLVDIVKQTHRPIALAGRVPCKIDGQYGAIHAGDRITSSATPGHAMKQARSGPSIGVALEDWTAPGTGKIIVLIQPGWFGIGEAHAGEATRDDSGGVADELATLRVQMADIQRQLAELTAKK